MLGPGSPPIENLFISTTTQQVTLSFGEYISITFKFNKFKNAIRKGMNNSINFLDIMFTKCKTHLYNIFLEIPLLQIISSRKIKLSSADNFIYRIVD